MRVLIYAPLAVLGHHFETDLEIAEDHLIKGDEVYMIRCNADLTPLQFTACLGCFRCDLCKSRGDEGVRFLSYKEKFHSIPLGPIQPIQWTKDCDLADLDNLKKLNYKGNDLGSAYVSSLISELRDPKPDLLSRWKTTETALNFMGGLHERFEQILEENKPDLVYLFNGRFCLFRPFLRICQRKKINFFVHERGNSNQFYSLTQNDMPHDLDTMNKIISDKWVEEKNSIEEKRSLASDWYEKRARGIGMAWSSFTSDQDLSKLPDNWDPKKRNISVFVSSDDEFESVPGWELPFFSTQRLNLDFICKSFEKESDFHFYVRIHPNLRGLKNRSMSELNALDKIYPNCTVVSAESPVSTYNLMKHSEKIITFGSTVGVEATYWGRPSILLGKAFYQFFNAALMPKNKEEIITTIAQKNITPASKEGALIYGYWAATVGYPFKYYKASSLTAGAFKGHFITGSKPLMFLNYFFVALRDIRKIFKGEYGFWHLKEKIKSKLKLFGKEQSSVG